MLERSVGIKTMYLHMYTAVIAHVCAVHCTYMHGEDITQGVPKTHMAIKRKGDGEIVSSSGLSFPFSFSFSLLPPSPPAEKGGERGKLLFLSYLLLTFVFAARDTFSRWNEGKRKKRCC